MFKHVVVGCGETAEGRDAVVLGAKISAATGAQLSLVGVFAAPMFPVAGWDDRQTLRRKTEKALGAERRQFAPDAAVHAVVDTSVPRGLSRYARRAHADLVIVGSDPNASLGHATISRRGRQLIDDSPFALAVAQRGLHEHDFALRSIGVGYDGGPEATAALDVSAQLARAAGAQLSVLSVVEDRLPSLTGREWMATKDWSTFRDGAREEALVRAETAAGTYDVPSQVEAVTGDPGLSLRTLTETVDLIVVGSRRWGTIARVVSGSVGETLVADSSCSVLIVPRPATKPRRSTTSRTSEPSHA